LLRKSSITRQTAPFSIDTVQQLQAKGTVSDAGDGPHHPCVGARGSHGPSPTATPCLVAPRPSTQPRGWGVDPLTPHTLGHSHLPACCKGTAFIWQHDANMANAIFIFGPSYFKQKFA